MVDLPDIAEKLKDNIEKEIKAIKKEKWEIVDKIVVENEIMINQLLEYKVQSKEEARLIEAMFGMLKELEKVLNKKIESIQKRIASIQNTDKNLDNLFTKTENPTYFIDEEK